MFETSATFKKTMATVAIIAGLGFGFGFDSSQPAEAAGLRHRPSQHIMHKPVHRPKPSVHHPRHQPPKHHVGHRRPHR